jgi:exopolysaccharide biosynthesis protein
VSKDGRKVIVVSVPEGANPDATYVKVAESLLAAGASHGINLDGGGSTALVVKNAGSFAEKIASTRSPPVNFGFK